MTEFRKARRKSAALPSQPRSENLLTHPNFSKPARFSRGRAASVAPPVTRSPATRRWTRSPLRIVPGMEMPSFERPIPGMLEGKLDLQLAALWIALNDKSTPSKIDTSTIEQVLTVAPGESAKIVRDVFNVGDALTPKFVPRAFAIGFDNGANVLLDLETMSFRGQWYGDF